MISSTFQSSPRPFLPPGSFDLFQQDHGFTAKAKCGRAATKFEKANLPRRSAKDTKGKYFLIDNHLRALRGSFEIGRCAGTVITLTFPLPQAGEGKKRFGAFRIEKSPRPFRWERVRVRAVSFSVRERKLMNHFVVKIHDRNTGDPKNLRKRWNFSSMTVHGVRRANGRVPFVAPFPPAANSLRTFGESRGLHPRIRSSCRLL